MTTAVGSRPPPFTITPVPETTVYYQRMMTFPPGGEPETHELGHLVAACQLGVPAHGIQADAAGYYLDRPQWADKPTPDQLVRMAVVAHAGPASEWLLVSAARTPAELMSDGDRSVLTKCEALFAEFYGRGLLWPDGLATFAAHLFVAPPVRRAVDALARGLKAVGWMPVSVANAVLHELGAVPADAPVIGVKAKPVEPAAPAVIDPEQFVGLGI